jgi:hypothetical protein
MPRERESLVGCPRIGGIRLKVGAAERTQPARSSRLLRRTLPVAVVGSASRNSTSLGTMKFSRRVRQAAMISYSVRVAPSSRTTKALIASPRISSGMPATAASFTPSMSKMAFSTSIGLTFSPRVLMMSSLRPTK